MRSSAKESHTGPRDSNTAEVGRERDKKQGREEELFETEKIILFSAYNCKECQRIQSCGYITQRAMMPYVHRMVLSVSKVLSQKVFHIKRILSYCPLRNTVSQGEDTREYWCRCNSTFKSGNIPEGIRLFKNEEAVNQGNYSGTDNWEDQTLITKRMKPSRGRQSFRGRTETTQIPFLTFTSINIKDYVRKDDNFYP